MYNKRLIGERFGRRLAQYNRVACVQLGITERLMGSLSALPGVGDFSSILEIGSGSGFLTRQLFSFYPSAGILALDLAPESSSFLPLGVDFRSTDGEYFVCGGGVDLIATSSTVQWFDDLEAFFRLSYSNLLEGGVLAFSTFGGDNFVEIRQTTSQGLDYYSLDELRAMVLGAGFEVLDSFEWRQQMDFGTPLDVLGHIRATGVNSIGTVRMSRSDLMSFQARYNELFGGGRLTFHPQILIARK